MSTNDEVEKREIWREEKVINSLDFFNRPF